MAARLKAPLPCRAADAELWFPITVSDFGQDPTNSEMKALKGCWGCPVTAECLADRLGWEIATCTDPFGVCGGMTAAQRRVAIRNRDRVAA